MSDRAGTPLYSVSEEIAHAVTHGLGLVVSIAGAFALVSAASVQGDMRHVVGCAVFSIALVLVYAASTLYHAAGSGAVKAVLRKLDHAAIFLLIAGTYTPFTLVSLEGETGHTLLAFVWGLAALGIVLQLSAPSLARRVSVPLYLGMGWVVVFAAEPLADAMPPEGLALLLAGGLTYSAGVVFYAWRRIPYNHAIWHLFVMAGSVFHFSCVMGYVVPPG